MDLPEPSRKEEASPASSLPFALGEDAGEMSEEALRQLNALLAEGPGEEASEEEVEAFMNRFLATEGGAHMLQSFAEQITEVGALDRMLKEEEAEGSLYTSLQSPARMVVRVDLFGFQPAIWRRLSFPADASFFDLHCAVQDAFGWQGNHPHRFELREQGRVEVTFGSEESEDEDYYCEVQNEIAEVFRNGCHLFHYLYGPGACWEHVVHIENLVAAGTQGTSSALAPMIHDGAGHGPPEECGGVKGFQEFLKGTHPLAAQYEPEVLAEFQEGVPDFSTVAFRDPAAVLRRKI